MTKIILCLGYNKIGRGWEGGKCLICGKQFSSPNNARRHVMEIHRTANQKFDCPICGKEFTQLRYFKQHMNYNHQPKYDPITNIEILPEFEGDFAQN